MMLRNQISNIIIYNWAGNMEVMFDASPQLTVLMAHTFLDWGSNSYFEASRWYWIQRKKFLLHYFTINPGARAIDCVHDGMVVGLIEDENWWCADCDIDSAMICKTKHKYDSVVKWCMVLVIWLTSWKIKHEWSQRVDCQVFACDTMMLRDITRN